MLCMAMPLLRPAFADSDYCDPHLKMSPEHPYGYRLRGNRCEGIYIEEVSSTPLSVVSLTAVFEDYGLTEGQAISIKWRSPPSPGHVRIRAQGIREGLFFRMDTSLAGSSASFTWPSNMLAALDIKKQDLGILGWTEHDFGAQGRVLYLPLLVRQMKRPRDSHGYRLVVLPGRELVEIYVSLASVNTDGLPPRYLQEGKPLKYGYYPAGQRITIPISYPPTAGVYLLELGATLRQGGATTANLLLYHPGG
jgi:hypothetical protein